MKTDHELLELAAKAAGISLHHWDNEPGYYEEGPRGPQRRYWNPLTDDGDALRLAVQLDLAVTPYPIYEYPKHAVLVQLKNLDASTFEAVQAHNEDRFAATRRAIVFAAAAIGEAMS